MVALTIVIMSLASFLFVGGISYGIYYIIRKFLKDPDMEFTDVHYTNSTQGPTNTATTATNGTNECDLLTYTESYPDGPPLHFRICTITPEDYNDPFAVKLSFTSNDNISVPPYEISKYILI